MLSRFPQEVRLEIFHIVFAKYRRGQIAVRVEETAERFTYKFTCEHDERNYAGAISCLNAAIVGEGVAAAASEALYKSDIAFAVAAKTLCTFLQSCPFLPVVKPGRYIKNLHFYMDEDPNFVGDGKDGQALRKTDWVDLGPHFGNDRVTRSGHRTHLMRQCWRAILKIPRLRWFEFWIMPSQGKVCNDDIKRFEIRDIIPTHFRLNRKRIHISINLRTWESYQGYKEWLEDLGLKDRHVVVDDDGFYETSLDLSPSVPYKWREPIDERILAENMLGPLTSYGTVDCFEHQRVRHYDALQNLLHRMHADKGITVVYPIAGNLG